MKATGIVRRIDELGRIVIPKEIRKTFRIKEGTPLEIFSNDNGELVLKKFSPLLELSDFAREACETIYDVLKFPTLVCDTDKVLFCSGLSKKDYLNKVITNEMGKNIEKRTATLIKKGEVNLCKIVDDMEEKVSSQIIVPIVVNGDVFGALIVLCKDDFKCLTQNDLTVVNTMALFISKQIE